MIVGYTTGVFDLFHVGHLNILARAKADCSYLIVGVTTDALALQLKGRRPVIPFEERLMIVQSIRHVDRAVAEDDACKMLAWQRYAFNRIYKGSDWQGTEQWRKQEDAFKQVDVEVKYFSYTQRTSSTLLRSVLERMGREDVAWSATLDASVGPPESTVTDAPPLTCVDVADSSRPKTPEDVAPALLRDCAPRSDAWRA